MHAALSFDANPDSNLANRFCCSALSELILSLPFFLEAEVEAGMHGRPSASRRRDSPQSAVEAGFSRRGLYGMWDLGWDLVGRSG